MLDNTHGNGKAIHGMTGCVNKQKTQTKAEGQMNKIPNTSPLELKITAESKVGVTGSGLKDKFTENENSVSICSLMLFHILSNNSIFCLTWHSLLLWGMCHFTTSRISMVVSCILHCKL